MYMPHYDLQVSVSLQLDRAMLNIGGSMYDSDFGLFHLKNKGVCQQKSNKIRG